MAEVFEATVRKVGTSLGLLIPKEIINEEKIKEGEKVKVGLLKKRTHRELREVSSLFGSAKGTKPFKRDHIDRLERYV